MSLRECEAAEAHTPVLLGLCNWGTEVWDACPLFLTQMLLQSYWEESCSSNGHSCREESLGVRHPHNEGMSQRKHHKSVRGGKDFDTWNHWLITNW
jgi:hypothetical protein